MDFLLQTNLGIPLVAPSTHLSTNEKPCIFAYLTSVSTENSLVMYSTSESLILHSSYLSTPTNVRIFHNLDYSKNIT